jgi:hypothetical protein
MQNAHLRMGLLQFTKITRDTTIDVRVHVDRAIAEHEADKRSALCHLPSIFGNDQEVAAIAAALSEEARFYLTGPDIDRLTISIGPEPSLYRSSLSIPGRRRPLRHLVVVSDELTKTCAGGNPGARRTVLCNGDPEFVLHRLGVRFGLPVLPEWSEWFADELRRRQAIEPLIGIGCCPVLVRGTKKRFLGWLGHGLKHGLIRIPASCQTNSWNLPANFEVPRASL